LLPGAVICKRAFFKIATKLHKTNYSSKTKRIYFEFYPKQPGRPKQNSLLMINPLYNTRLPSLPVLAKRESRSPQCCSHAYAAQPRSDAHSTASPATLFNNARCTATQLPPIRSSNADRGSFSVNTSPAANAAPDCLIVSPVSSLTTVYCF